jgi:hypothetical protein
MYLRGQAIRKGEDYSLATVEGTDFWRSQVLGVRTSVYPPLARSVVSRQSDKQLSVNDQRPPGRKVNRLRANIEFALLNDEETMELVESIWVAPTQIAEQMQTETGPKTTTPSSKKMTTRKKKA